VRVRVLVNTLKDAVTIPPRRQRLFREFAITVRRADRVSRSSALPPNRNSLAGATRTPLAGAQPVRAGGIQRAPRSRLLQTSTLEGAPGTAKAGYAEDPPQGGFGPSAACAVAPQRSTITAERNGFTRPQPLAFANDSSAPRHSGARRAIPPIGSEPLLCNSMPALAGSGGYTERASLTTRRGRSRCSGWRVGRSVLFQSQLSPPLRRDPSRAAPRPSPGAKHRLPAKHVELACEA
jgi:hypothetical protein